MKGLETRLPSQRDLALRETKEDKPTWTAMVYIPFCTLTDYCFFVYSTHFEGSPYPFLFGSMPQEGLLCNLKSITASINLVQTLCGAQCPHGAAGRSNDLPVCLTAGHTTPNVQQGGDETLSFKKEAGPLAGEMKRSIFHSGGG
jgi:hypothetical protein